MPAIANRSYKTGQGTHKEVLFSHYERVFRLHAYWDTYAFQSYAEVKVLDPTRNKWNTWCVIPYPLMAGVGDGLYVKPEDVTTVVDQLTADAKQLVSLIRSGGRP